MENKKTSPVYFLLISLALLLILLVSVSRLINYFKKEPNLGGNTNNPIITQFSRLEKFKSEAEYKQYIERNQQGRVEFGSSRFGLGVMPMVDVMMKSSESVPVSGGGANTAITRTSETNVQVQGIDEPDIIKVNKENIFYSTIRRLTEIDIRQSTEIEPLIMEKRASVPFRRNSGETLAIKAYPPQEMDLISAINKNGDLLIDKNTLIVFSEDWSNKRGIYGYDITNPKNPVEKWKLVFKKSLYKVQARLYQGKLYLVSRTGTKVNRCLLETFESDIAPIRCTDIYYPNINTNSDAIYTVSVINPTNGEVEKNLSFVGSTSESTVYMSNKAIYVGYFFNGDFIAIISDFFNLNSHLLPTNVIERLNKLKNYDISYQSKLTEFGKVISDYTDSLDESEKLKFENNLNNKIKDYLNKRKRDLEKTGIIKINADSLKIEATGEIAGKLLNQFSLDEYEGYLRVASTVGGRNSWFGSFGNISQSESEVNVLNSQLKIVGSVQGLGKTERIYSVRFINDRGYVVTFRETDPFYVLDLQDPNNPKLKGELKIPGYSGYLHPLSLNKILGVGKEGSNVKLSIFDVSNAEYPSEIEKYTLDEYWSEALNNHHAFLADEKNQIFFMPGGKGGYVFSYAGNKLELKKAVSDYQIKRAVYINNYLYIIGDDQITVLDESNWDKVAELDL